jgi:hypothetical protein
MIEGLRGHFTLVCRDAEQALSAAEAFCPDVMLIDLALPGAAELPRRLSDLLGRDDLTFVGVTGSDGFADSVLSESEHFEYELSLPTAMCEVEQLLWRINLQRESDKQLSIGDAVAGELTG